MEMAELLQFAVKNGASDLHLSADMPPLVRVSGDIKKLDIDAFGQKEVSDLISSIMPQNKQAEYDETLEVDFSYEVPNLARFRVNAFQQDRGQAAVFRTIPNEILTLEDINAPSVFRDLVANKSGLILVTGSTGSGKSTTLAAMVDEKNKNEQGHILTIEDPIEFVHDSKKSLINQRELGKDTLGFSSALRSALREDPDTILVGELRDMETIRLALTAAETGHLVLATLHTHSAPKTIDRIIDVFPGAEKNMVRSMLSESLKAVISQALIKKKSGGRIAVNEIMVATPAIRNLIREDKVAQMHSSIQAGRNEGMTTMDQSLNALLKSGAISMDQAKNNATNIKMIG